MCKVSYFLNNINYSLHTFICIELIQTNMHVHLSQMHAQAIDKFLQRMSHFIQLHVIVFRQPFSFKLGKIGYFV